MVLPNTYHEFHLLTADTLLSYDTNLANPTPASTWNGIQAFPMLVAPYAGVGRRVGIWIQTMTLCFNTLPLTCLTTLKTTAYLHHPAPTCKQAPCWWCLLEPPSDGSSPTNKGHALCPPNLPPYNQSHITRDMLKASATHPQRCCISQTARPTF